MTQQSRFSENSHYDSKKAKVSCAVQYLFPMSTKRRKTEQRSPVSVVRTFGQSAVCSYRNRDSARRRDGPNYSQLEIDSSGKSDSRIWFNRRLGWPAVVVSKTSTKFRPTVKGAGHEYSFSRGT